MSLGEKLINAALVVAGINPDTVEDAELTFRRNGPPELKFKLHQTADQILIDIRKAPVRKDEHGS